MVVAYVLFVVDPGSETKIASGLMKKKEVKDVSVVYGEYDIVAKIDVDSMAELQDFVISSRKSKEIKRTTTMISVQ
jgi:DNA-binding Lrp family transcriptional regulator